MKEREYIEGLYDTYKNLLTDREREYFENYFYERIQRKEITVDELYDAICCLEIISIQLNQDDNPQLIFESLNSTGLALSEGDKIRNFILMGLPTKQQEDFYEKYWNRIEECTGYDVSSFVRDYLSVKQSAIPQISRVYYTFKLYVEEGGVGTETKVKAKRKTRGKTSRFLFELTQQFRTFNTMVKSLSIRLQHRQAEALTQGRFL